MATTPKFSLRYPVSGDAPNVPYDMGNLATDVDNAMNGMTAHIGGVRGTTDRSTGNGSIMAISLPASPAGSLWVVNVFAQIKPLNQPDNFGLGPITPVNCTTNFGHVTWRLSAGFWSVVQATGWELTVSANATCSVVAQLDVGDPSTQWEVVSNSYWQALRRK